MFVFANAFTKQLSRFIVVVLFLFGNVLQAQITVSPAKPLTNGKITFVYDAGKGNKALFGLTDDLYFHTGVITSTSRDENDWKFVVGNWGKADELVKMTPLGGDKYQFEFTPDDFYHYPPETKVNQLAFVFRDAKGEKVGKTEGESNILVPVNGYRPAEKEQADYAFDNREYISHTLKDGVLQVETTHGTYVFTPYTDAIVHVDFWPENTPTNYHSVSVVAQPQAVETAIVDVCEEVNFLSGEIEINIQKSPFKVTYYYQNKLLFEEEKGFFERSDNNGIRFKMADDEHIYGTGERSVPLDRRGYRLGLYNRPDYNYGVNAQNLNFVLPVVLSSKKYLVLFDNPQKGYFDLGFTENDILEFGTIGGPMNYYLVAGEDFEQINEYYVDLTGHQPLPPRWVLGNLQSRMAYRTQEELEGIVDEMQQKDFPLDAVIIDFYWFGDSILGGLGNLKWYEKNWPNPKRMIADFKEKGVKTVLITEPMVIDTAYWFTHGDTAKLFATNKEGETYIMKEFYFGHGALLDIFKQKTKDWFWERYQEQIKIGVAGWWSDLGEPETHPSDMIHVNGTADEVHNIYALEWEKMLFEKYRKYYPETRLFHLNRAGAAGSQRYSIFPWSGDVARSWSGFQAQLPLMLNMSMTGLGYISSDLGGFAIGEKNEELYMRWLQFGTFNPIYRPHGSFVPSEPIFYSEKVQDIVRESIRLRYRLMPYIYTLSYENTVYGKPLVKPLFYLEPENPAFLNYSDAYLFGDAFLVAPIINPGVQTKKIRFPYGIWYDFYTDQQIIGGNELEVAVNDETIPVFVKAGSFIPMAPDFKTTDDYPVDLTVHYYPLSNAETTGVLYEDDGATFSALTDENYQLTRFVASNAPKLLHLVVELENKQKTNIQRKLQLIVHHTDKKPKRVYVNGSLLKFSRKNDGDCEWDESRKLLILSVDWDNRDLDIRIEK